MNWNICLGAIALLGLMGGQVQAQTMKTDHTIVLSLQVLATSAVETYQTTTLEPPDKSEPDSTKSGSSWLRQDG